MRTGLLCLLVFTLLTGCPPPDEGNCQRLLVDASGGMNQGFGGGTPPLPPQVGMAGTPLNLTLFAPLTACVSDTLRTEVKVQDPDNLRLPEPEGSPTRTGLNGVVVRALNFTPTKPGIYTVQVAFEPSLGVRSLLVDVAANGLAGNTTRLAIPSGAGCYANELWPLSDDSMACEERANANVSISSADGGLSRFPGAELVVVGEVLWSINAQTSTLERRVFEDGGVRLTHSFADFPGLASPAMHDVDVALRFRSNGRLAVVRVLPDAGVRVVEHALGDPVGSPLAYFVEDNDAFFRWSSVDCAFSSCTNFTDVIALEPGLVWRPGFSGLEQGSTPSKLNGYARPLFSENANPRFSLVHRAESVLSPAHAFERLPLWLDAATGSQRVLVSGSLDGVSFSAWPRSDVVRVGRQHVILTDANDPGFVRIIRR